MVCLYLLFIWASAVTSRLDLDGLLFTSSTSKRERKQDIKSILHIFISSAFLKNILPGTNWSWGSDTSYEPLPAVKISLCYCLVTELNSHTFSFLQRASQTSAGLGEARGGEVSPSNWFFCWSICWAGCCWVFFFLRTSSTPLWRLWGRAQIQELWEWIVYSIKMPDSAKPGRCGPMNDW